MKANGRVESIEYPASQLEVPLLSVYRYLGMGRTQPDAALTSLAEQCAGEFQAVARYRACRLVLPVAVKGELVDFGVFSLSSKSLSKNLSGCRQAILFAATTGAEGERLQKRTAITSPAKAVVLDALGTAAIEHFCDTLCRRWAAQFPGQRLRPRFSPGYGDVPLELQKTLLSCLDSHRKAGITLTQSLLMVPQKSVSAMVGIGSTGCETALHDCQLCDKTDCQFRI